MSNNTVEEIQSQVQDLVANNKLTKAIALLVAHFKELDDDPRHQAALKISGQMKAIEKKLNMSEMTQENADVGISKIKDAILNIFDKIPFMEEEDVPVERDKFADRIIQVSALLIILFLIIGIIAAISVEGFSPIIDALIASLFVVGTAMIAFGLLFMVKKYILV